MRREPWETGDRRTFRAGFDEDAVAYDRTRPVAPPEVFDDVVRSAGLAPGSAVVEIGPGTGQATRPLVERGLRILGLELGGHLAARARENLAGFPDVTVRQSSFEAWDPDGERFDAVVACNSFHWVEPDVRLAKVAEVLVAHGHLVVLATPVVVPDGAARFRWDGQDNWAAVGAERVDPSTKHRDLVSELGPEIRASGFFDGCTVVRRPFDVALTAEQYATNLSTQSGVKQLRPDAQEELVRRAQHRIEDRGGRLAVHHLAVLTVARRSD